MPHVRVSAPLCTSKPIDFFLSCFRQCPFVLCLIFLRNRVAKVVPPKIAKKNVLRDLQEEVKQNVFCNWLSCFQWPSFLLVPFPDLEAKLFVDFNVGRCLTSCLHISYLPHPWKAQTYSEQVGHGDQNHHSAIACSMQKNVFM